VAFETREWELQTAEKHSAEPEASLAEKDHLRQGLWKVLSMRVAEDREASRLIRTISEQERVIGELRSALWSHGIEPTI
jgi:hypothetical protein